MRSLLAACGALLACCVTDAGPSSPPARPALHGKDFSSGRHSHPDAPAVALPAAYLAAVRRAQRATAQDASRQLTPIRPDNRALLWRTATGKEQVLVATWTTHRSYYPPQGVTFVESYPVWVTAAPELKNFCRSHAASGSATPLPRRLEQLLGLPPDSGHEFIVELWVAPSDLFRPSADPEITDREAQLTFPEVPGYLSVSAEFKAWYEQTCDARYRPVHGPAYPWTRLGYTYDWGAPRAPVGLSEFVIRPGAEVTVHAVTATSSYGGS